MTPKDFLTLPYWENRLAVNIDEFDRDQSARFFFELTDKPGTIAGVANLTQIARGPFKLAFKEKHLPENTRSANVLKRLGFRVDGSSPDYLHVQGHWREHVLNSLTNPNWTPREADRPLFQEQ